MSIVFECGRLSGPLSVVFAPPSMHHAESDICSVTLTRFNIPTGWEKPWPRTRHVFPCAHRALNALGSVPGYAPHSVHLFKQLDACNPQASTEFLLIKTSIQLERSPLFLTNDSMSLTLRTLRRGIAGKTHFMLAPCPTVMETDRTGWQDYFPL